MELEVDVLIHVCRQRVAIEFFGSLVGKVTQIFCLKLDTVYLVVTAQSVDYLLSFLGWQLILSVLITGKLLVEVLLRHPLAQLFLRAKAFRNGEERHDRSMVDAIDFYLI